ncbi:MAG: DUF3887 domain-containing protein [Peptococcaceae bacterium]|nr:DUF3887 domain-containing protein [Peptococcaceae bacterium]
MRKWLIGVVCIVVLFGMVGCGGNSAPEWADEDALVAKAQTMIDALNAQDIDKVVAIYNHPEVTAESFAESSQLVKDMGAFENYGEYSLEGGATDDGQEYARLIQTATYEGGTLIYTISFFEDGSVAGFYVTQ